MPRVPVHDLQSAPEASRADLKALEERFGRIVNIFGGMAHAPALIGLYTAAETMLSERTSLERATRDAIHLAVAAVNGCDYCQAAYTMAARRSGFDEEQTVKIRTGEVDFDNRLAALLPVAREAAAHRGHVADETWQRALDAGWSTAQLLETFADVARTILTNYFNHLVGTESDFPPAPPIDR